jgi:hypothetical protein
MEDGIKPIRVMEVTDAFGETISPIIQHSDGIYINMHGPLIKLDRNQLATLKQMLAHCPELLFTR